MKISFYPRVFNTLSMRILQETKNRFFHRQELQSPLKAMDQLDHVTLVNAITVYKTIRKLST